MREKYYYCQFQIETDGEACGNQCSHCKNYYYPLEQERKMEDLKEWIENKDEYAYNKFLLYGERDLTEDENEALEIAFKKSLIKTPTLNRK